MALFWQAALLVLSAQQAAVSGSGTDALLPPPSSKPVAVGQNRTTLDTVVVEDVPVTQNILPNGPSSSVYGLNTSLQDTPRVVSQIGSEQYKNSLIRNSNDFVYYTPGLMIQGSQGDPVQPFIRGQAGQVYLNGFLAGVSGTWLGPGVGNNAIESVDIVAGPANVVYGPSSLTSGYLNYTTKQPYFDGFRGSVTTDFGTWVSGGSSYPNFRQTIDVGGPLIKDQLAYRASIQKQEANGFYNGTRDNYNDAYFAVNWIPNKDVEVDYNLEWKTVDQLYTSGMNRKTDALISNGTYLSGPAIPIIQLNTAVGGVKYYSPVLNAAGQVTGYVARTANGASTATATKYAAGAAFDPNTAFAGNNALRAQVVGYVLDPTLTTPTRAYANQTNTDGDGVGADWEVHQQGKVKITYNDELTLLDEADLDLGSISLANAAGPSTYEKQAYFEDRLHAQLHKEYALLGLDIDHQSDSGIAFRYENVNQDAKTSPTTNAFGNMLLSPDPNTNLGGAPVVGSNGYVTGGYFGNLPTAWAPRYNSVPYGNYLGSPGSVFQDWDAQTGIFSQHNFKFGEQWGLNFGARADELYVHVINPITATGVAIAGPTSSSLAGQDSSNYLLPSLNSSLTYKPVPWTTTYLTFDYSQAYNASNAGPGGFTLTGVSATNPGNLSPENFHSASILYEAGSKFEFIPKQLFGSVAGFYQERSQYIALSNTSAPLEAHGVDVSLRYQPTKNFTFGANGEWINAHYSRFSYSSAAIYSANGIAVDNATLFGSSQFTNNQSAVGNYRVPNIPYLNSSGFAEYKLDSGLGFNARAWWMSSYPIDVSNQLCVPSQYNLDLGVFYERPRWRADLDITNVTDNWTIEPNSAGLIVEAPIGLSGKVRINF